MKVELLLLFVFFNMGILFAQDNYNAEQASFRDDIGQFLKEEGYAPSVNDNTGDINFKMEGVDYVISLDVDYNSPYLVTLGTFFELDELSNSDKLKLFEAENALNAQHSCVKAVYHELERGNFLLFDIESFCHNSEDFKYALVRYLGLMKNAINEFSTIYQEVLSQLDSESYDINASNVDSKEPIEKSSVYVISPKYYTKTDNSNCIITGYELGTKETKVYFEYTPSSEGWCSIAPNTYIETLSGKRYSLIRAVGIPISPDRHYFARGGQKLNFSLIFQPLPQDTKMFDIIESSSSSWNFYFIQDHEDNK